MPIIQKTPRLLGAGEGRARKCYVRRITTWVRLENYLEAVVSTLAQVRPAGPTKRPKLPAGTSQTGSSRGSLEKLP